MILKRLCTTLGIKLVTLISMVYGTQLDPDAFILLVRTQGGKFNEFVTESIPPSSATTNPFDLLPQLGANIGVIINYIGIVPPIQSSTDLVDRVKALLNNLGYRGASTDSALVRSNDINLGLDGAVGNLLVDSDLELTAMSKIGIAKKLVGPTDVDASNPNRVYATIGLPLISRLTALNTDLHGTASSTARDTVTTVKSLLGAKNGTPAEDPVLARTRAVNEGLDGQPATGSAVTKISSIKTRLGSPNAAPADDPVLTRVNSINSLLVASGNAGPTYTTIVNLNALLGFLSSSAETTTQRINSIGNNLGTVANYPTPGINISSTDILSKVGYMKKLLGAVNQGNTYSFTTIVIFNPVYFFTEFTDRQLASEGDALIKRAEDINLSLNGVIYYPGFDPLSPFGVSLPSPDNALTKIGRMKRVLGSIGPSGDQSSNLALPDNQFALTGTSLESRVNTVKGYVGGPAATVVENLDNIIVDKIGITNFKPFDVGGFFTSAENVYTDLDNLRLFFRQRVREKGGAAGPNDISQGINSPGGYLQDPNASLGQMLEEILQHITT